MSTLRTQLVRFRSLLVAAVIVIIVLLTALATGRSGPAVLPTDSIERVQTRTVEQIVSVDGNLNGAEERDIFVPAQVKLTELSVVVGQHVSEGALIGKYDQASGLTFKTFNINTPIEGVVTVANYHVNDVVANPALPVYHVVDTSSYVVTLNVNENDIANLETGQPARITIPAISLETQITGKVSFISPAPTTTGGTVTYLVKVTPETIPANVKPGMSAFVDITTQRVDNVLAIPESFLIDHDGKNYIKLLVWLDDAHTNYRLDETEVTVGLKTDQYIEIKSGITEGSEIVEPAFTIERQGLFGF